ncbi:MAG: 13E12 repeat family protein, partial [Actinomycetota bacterium]|nr:13E12 repeat family protein [Actinomycetota bacterium]
MKASRDQELDLVAGLDSWHARATNALSNFFSFISQADSAELWRSDGCRDMAEWIAGRYGISKWQARRWVDASHRLGDLPSIAAAFESGDLCVEKVVELTRYATPSTEASLVSWAQRVRPATIRHQADLAVSRSIKETHETEKSRYLEWS